MENITNSNRCTHNNEILEVELSDTDIIDAMQHISGYIDITTEDFRELYHLAYHHAIERLLTKIQPKNLMRVVNEPLLADMPLDQAAAILIRSDFKSLPVLDANGCVVGILTDTDFLRWHKANTFLEILLNMADNAFDFNHVYHETSVSAIMTAPAITVSETASFGEIVHAFYLHDRRSMPIIDTDNHLLGLLMRKDFICAWKLITG